VYQPGLGVSRVRLVLSARAAHAAEVV